MSQPVAYIRKSRVTNDHTVSWEVQEQAVRALAAQRGDADVMVLSDWNKSGRGTDRRPGYRQMVEMIDRGEVSAIYAYNLSRLSRSLKDFTTLVELCLAKGVPIRFTAESNLNVEATAAASHALMLNVMASFAQFDADIAKERARDAVAVRRARGDRIGHPFYGERPGESTDAVVAAYREAGSVLGAAKLLNEWKIPTRQGRPWGTTPVRETLLRLGAMPNRSRPGVKAAAPFILFQLLRCHCGATMTGSRYRNGPDLAYTTYRCIRGRADANHGRGNLTEKAVLPWVMAEAARLRIPKAVPVESTDERRSFLREKRERIIDAHLDGTIDKATRNDKLREVDEEVDNLSRVSGLIAVPKLDWTWAPKEINAVLRSMWGHVQLDDDLRPVRADWQLPAAFVR